MNQRWLTPALACAFGLLARSAQGQELLYQEGFNDDGSAANPARYTFTGRDVYEVPRIQTELGNYDQKGPIYWAHNFNVSYVGNPTIPARRMIFTWRGVDATTASEDLLKLFDASVKWLLNDKANATIVVNPNAAAIQGLADRLVAAGHTVLDDDTAATPDEQDVVADLMIHGPGANNPSRFVLVTKPVIVMNAPDYDDMLVGSIGTAVSFEPGQMTITATNHPAAGGMTGSFNALTGSHPFELVGTVLPTNALTLATIKRVVPPAVTSLADVESMIAGTKTHEKTTGQVTTLDFADASTGNWVNDNPLPGGYTGNWGLEAKGRLNVTAAGTYRFALGSDDGARLQIDLDRNGFTAEDVVLEDAGPHAHQIVYANITFAASGNYDLRVVSYNNGGGGDLEVSVAIQAGEIPDDSLASGYWEVLSSDFATSPVKLVGQVDVTGFIATGPNEERQEPLVVLLNGPADAPPGAFYDGGPFTGFEGTGFLAASGLNKWAYPDGGTYRSVRLKPVNVAGKTKVKLTLALAATVVDFEDSDFVDVVVYPNGESSSPVTLAHFRGVQNAVQPWLADQKRNFERRLTRRFADFTYDIPAGATDLIAEIRAATTWWTETAAIDNIRITSGEIATGPTLGKPTVSGSDVVLTWTGGQSPFLVQWSPGLANAWIDLYTTTGSSATLPMVGPAGFFRVQSGTTQTVSLFKAVLSGAAEVPVVDTPAKGSAVLAMNGDSLTYYVYYAGLKATATLAHLHGPATTTATAPPLFDLVPVPAFGMEGILQGTRVLTAAEKAHLQGGQTYVNIHTSVHGGGEIRGQATSVP